jgi:hypothetical protein
MKGVIYTLVEDVVRREHGDEEWDEVVTAAGVTGAYTSLGSYPDEELQRIAEAVAERNATDASAIVRHVGHRGMATLAARYPQFFEPHDTLRSFLLSLNAIIHPEVRKLYPGAEVPDFEMSGPDAHVLELAYRSDRGRCDLAEGLILGAAEHYREAIELSQPTCVHRGDDRCVLRVVSL